MIHSQSDLDAQGRARFRAATAFLKGRLAEPETVDWALRLRSDRQIERMAIFELVAGHDAPRLREPYATAWPLILESWSNRASDASPSSMHLQILRRLQGGDRSGNLVEEIANFAAPRLEVKPLQARPWSPARKSRRPKKLNDLLSAGLTSASLFVDFRSHRIDIGLDEVADTAFLHAVAGALMSEVDRGLYIARRVYGSTEEDWPAMASPLRVYFVPPEIGVNDWDGPGGRVFEPDAPIRGLGPAVKLLHAVLQRIAELDIGTATSFLGRWRQSDIEVYRRLWAAAARNANAVSAADAGEFLTALDDSDFWNFPSYPEFAEMRAVRFPDLEPETQTLILRRLRKGLPRRYFPKKLEAEEIRAMRRMFTAMELRRIEIGGGNLPAQDRDWLLKAADEFPGLEKMAIDGGFRDPWVRPYFPARASLKSRFDDLEGETRLRALEDALSGETSDDQAAAWLRRSDHAVHTLRDLEGVASRVNRFPQLWDHFGHTHSPPDAKPESDTPRDARSEAALVLGLMNRLSEATVQIAIDGICQWLYMWSEHVIGSELGRHVWLRAWPFAVEVTNAAETSDDKGFSKPTIRTDDEDRTRRDIDAFHLPVGKLLRVFQELFRFTDETRDPFTGGSQFAQMRDQAFAAPGHSGLIARCQFTQNLPDFLKIDPVWTRRYLVEPLMKDDDDSVTLWQALASAWIDSELLRTIGEEASKKVLDGRLGRNTRKDLVSCLVHEGLDAFKDGREPSISQARISQVLRAADDEIREWAAFDIRYFQEYEYKGGQGPRALGDFFLSNIKPFLNRVWPQERSLSTGGVSHHLACLPAVSGEAFADAVQEIERFLIPFDCSSMLEYGFFEGEKSKDFGMPQLSDAIDDSPKAHAFLRLLDLTVGDSETAAVPEDLSAALERIESLAPNLTSDSAFRRLAAAARR